MRTLVLVPVLGLLRQAAASCCRGNACLKAIANAGQGTQDCSANLVITVTADASTVTATGAPVTVYQTDVVTDVATVTDTSTISTETDVVVVSETVVAATETDTSFVTQKVATTQTDTDDVLVTTTVIPWRRQASGGTVSSPVLPTYASQCVAWANYVSACRCAGVIPLTVTVAAPPTTVTAGAASTVTFSLLSTLASTETVVDTIAASISTTETEIVSATTTTLVTQTVTDVETITALATATQTTTAEVSLETANVADFRAVITDVGTTPLYLDVILGPSGTNGPMDWQAASTSSTSSVQSKYILAIDSEGRVTMPNLATGPHYLYLPSSAEGSVSFRVQANTLANTQGLVEAGGTWVYGAVDPATNRLYFNAAGRKNFLDCAGEFWLSSGDGSDVEIGSGCTIVYPTVTSLVS